AGRRLAAAEQAGLGHVPRRQVGPRPAPPGFVLAPHRARPPWWQGWVAAAACLDAGLLVGADDIGVRLQFLALEDPVVQVQDDPGFGGEVGIAGKDPGAVLPRL